MLSQTSRQEIQRKIALKAGYAFNELTLTPATRQAMTNLAIVQRHLIAITELLRGENSRVEKSVILRTAAKMGRDSEKAERASLSAEMASLQSEVDTKVAQIAVQVVAEDFARQSGQRPPEYHGNAELVELKCPSCGAALPMPAGRFTTCQYCKETFSVQDVSPQLRTMIQGI